MQARGGEARGELPPRLLSRRPGVRAALAAAATTWAVALAALTRARRAREPGVCGSLTALVAPAASVVPTARFFPGVKPGVALAAAGVLPERRGESGGRAEDAGASSSNEIRSPGPRAGLCGERRNPRRSAAGWRGGSLSSCAGAARPWASAAQG